MTQFDVDQQKMASQHQKRWRVPDLLYAKVKVKSISDVVGLSLKTLYNIKKVMITEYGIKRKSSRGGSNKKEILHFMKP